MQAKHCEKRRASPGPRDPHHKLICASLSLSKKRNQLSSAHTIMTEAGRWCVDASHMWVTISLDRRTFQILSTRSRPANRLPHTAKGAPAPPQPRCTRCVPATLDKAAVQSRFLQACLARRDRMIGAGGGPPRGPRCGAWIDKFVRLLESAYCATLSAIATTGLSASGSHSATLLAISLPQIYCIITLHAAAGRMQECGGRCAALMARVHQEIQQNVSSWLKSRMKG